MYNIQTKSKKLDIRNATLNLNYFQKLPTLKTKYEISPIECMSRAQTKCTPLWLPQGIKPSLTHFRPTYKTVGGNNLDTLCA